MKKSHNNFEKVNHFLHLIIFMIFLNLFVLFFGNIARASLIIENNIILDNYKYF